MSDAKRAKLLTLAEVGQRAGVQDSTIHAYHARAQQRRRRNESRPGDLPAPDQVYGRTPLWKASTIDRWLRKRPGQGAGGGRPWHKERDSAGGTGGEA